MFGIPKKWLDAGSRAAAGAGLVTNLLGSAVPPMVKANTDAGKQFANYSKEVRLPPKPPGHQEDPRVRRAPQ